MRAEQLRSAPLPIQRETAKQVTKPETSCYGVFSPRVKSFGEQLLCHWLLLQGLSQQPIPNW